MPNLGFLSWMIPSGNQEAKDKTGRLQPEYIVLESKECTPRAPPQETKHPLNSKRQLWNTRTYPRCHTRTKEVLNPDNCTQKRNQSTEEGTKTQLDAVRTLPGKAAKVVQTLGAILWQQLRMPHYQKKTSEDPEECECSICKRNKGMKQGTLETHMPVPVAIRSIRITQERHKILTIGTT